MKYNEVSPLERYFTEEREEKIKEELLGSGDRPEFDRFVTRCKVCLERDEFGDGFSARLVGFYCWLIDNEKKDELLTLIAIYPFWGIYAPEEDELAPLCYAIYKHETEIAKEMIRMQSAADWLHVWESYQPGYIAIKEQQYDVIRYLLDSGVDENYFAGPYTGLQLAVRDMDPEAAKIFVEEYGQDVNRTVVIKRPPLVYAVDNDDLPMAEYLLSRPGIDVNKPAEDGNNAVEHAKSEKMRDLLLMHGAGPSSENTKLVCAAIKAAVDCEAEALECLTEKLVAIEGASAIVGEFDLLYHTVKYDHFNAAKLIIENGLVDLGNYRQNLFGLCSCAHGKNRSGRTAAERLAYMRLFEKHGYKFLFPPESCQHQLAARILIEETKPTLLREMSAIMERAGVILDD